VVTVAARQEKGGKADKTVPKGWDPGTEEKRVQNRLAGRCRENVLHELFFWKSKGGGSLNRSQKFQKEDREKGRMRKKYWGGKGISFKGGAILFASRWGEAGGDEMAANGATGWRGKGNLTARGTTFVFRTWGWGVWDVFKGTKTLGRVTKGGGNMENRTLSGRGRAGGGKRGGGERVGKIEREGAWVWLRFGRCKKTTDCGGDQTVGTKKRVGGAAARISFFVSGGWEGRAGFSNPAEGGGGFGALGEGVGGYWNTMEKKKGYRLHSSGP